MIFTYSTWSSGFSPGVVCLRSSFIGGLPPDFWDRFETARRKDTCLAEFTFRFEPYTSFTADISGPRAKNEC
jgi:hypothetical protein